MPHLTFWYDFASTYSYPAAMRVEPAAAARGVLVRWRPFLLGPLFADQGWRDSPFNIYPAKGRYMWRDMERICQARGLPFARPPVFPQNSLRAARIATILQGPARVAFSQAVYAAEFGRGEAIDGEAALGAILAALDLPAEALLAEAGGEPAKVALRKSGEEAKSLGLFGAPAFTTASGELFWGDDRLDAALDWAAREKA
ncbi:MAG: 2-hydroxychromene-2-carboxylate isomerase [Hyphomicrobiales bacterium]|nr:2-hydroxychromene-2-carboxylate isomerase [Hyphomicrobiales bacterium]